MTNIIMGFAEDSGNVTLTGEIAGPGKTSNVDIETIDDSLNLSGSLLIRPSEKIDLASIYDTLTLPGSLRVSHQQGNVFIDFASFPLGNIDPAIGSIQSKVSGVAAYDSGQPSNFRRVNLLAQVAQDSIYGKRVAFVAPGVRVNAMAAGNRVHVDAAQVEVARDNGTVPSAYSPARSLQIGVRPDRLNYMPNPSVEVNTNDLNAQFCTVSRDNTWAATGAGTWSAKTQPNSASNDCYLAPGGDSGAVRLGLRPGVTYTVAATCYTPVAQGGTLHVRARRIAVWTKAGTDPYVEVRSPAAPTVGQARVKVSFTVPTGATEVFIRLYNGADNTSANAVFWDAIVVEPGVTDGSYFDGGSGNDYLWEQGGTAGNARSYYYKDYAARAYLLKQTIAENCPLGVIPAAPQFAVLPKT